MDLQTLLLTSINYKYNNYEDPSFEEMVREDMVKHGYDPLLKDDVEEYWKERLT